MTTDPDDRLRPIHDLPLEEQTSALWVMAGYLNVTVGPDIMRRAVEVAVKSVDGRIKK